MAVVNRVDTGSVGGTDFAGLYHRHVIPVYRYLHARLGNHQDAEDVTSAAFLRAWRSFGAYEPTEPFAPWLFTIVKRTLADHLRRRRATESAPEIEPSFRSKSSRKRAPF